VRARALAVLLVAPMAACMVGPAYQPSSPMPADARVRVVTARDSTRAFFDSLAAARRRDSVTVGAPHVAERTLAADSLTSVAWLSILRDTTLQRLVGTAIHQNRDVQTAIARIREYRADAGEAEAYLYPTVAATATGSKNRIAFGTLGLTYNAFTVAGNVSWELDFWGRVRRGLAAANADVGAQEAAQRATVLSLVSDVATGYLQLLELDQEQSIARRTLASRQSTLQLARDRFRQGVISELDVRQFEAQVAAPAITLAQAERARSQAEHYLSVLLGEAPVAIPRGGTLVQAVTALTVPDSVPASLLVRRPDVQQAERAYAAATARVGVTEASHMPTVMVTGQYGTQSGTVGNLFGSGTQIYQALIGVSVPVFNDGRLANETAAARARAEQARLQYEQAALNALRDASDALVGVRTARDEAVAQATQAQALRQALDLAQIRYDAGLASYLDVLDAQRSLFSAELALSQAQLQQLTAAVQLYKALGGSWTPERN
jgi:outer membrane protein, multidrug efflux system